MKKIKISVRLFSFVAMGVLLISAGSCKKKDSNTTPTLPTSGTVSDYDGNSYNYITIGTQAWITSNLKVKHYNDGTAIPYSATASSSGAYCYYNTTDIPKYGLLYNWYAVSSGKLAPSGWHVPTSADWSTLITYLGGTSSAGGAMKEAGTSDWTSPNTGATNSSGFTALPGGYDNGTPVDITNDGNFWSSTSASSTNAYYIYLYYGSAIAQQNSGIQKMGVSVRLVRD